MEKQELKNLVEQSQLEFSEEELESFLQNFAELEKLLNNFLKLKLGNTSLRERIINKKISLNDLWEMNYQNQRINQEILNNNSSISSKNFITLPLKKKKN